MKQLLSTIICLISLFGCIPKDIEENFVVSGNLYKDCAKLAMANVELEMVETGGGLGGQKTTSLVRTKTSASGGYTLSYKANKNSKLVIQIPANDEAQRYSSIPLAYVKAASAESFNIYLEGLTDIKIKLKCNRAYTNQDTFYISGGTPKIVNPQDGQVVATFKQGARPDLAVNYGIGWLDYQKSVKSGVSYPQIDYNILRLMYPSCDKSPMEIVLNLP